jgi:hypothetical protein
MRKKQVVYMIRWLNPVVFSERMENFALAHMKKLLTNASTWLKLQNIACGTQLT